MKYLRQFPARMSAVLGTTCALLVLTLSAHASDHWGAFTEEFHKTYELTPDGRVELENINGSVHISTWEQNQVKVDAVKYADSREKLEEANIEIDAGKEYVSIRTKYPEHGAWGGNNNPA